MRIKRTLGFILLPVAGYALIAGILYSVGLFWVMVACMSKPGLC